MPELMELIPELAEVMQTLQKLLAQLESQTTKLEALQQRNEEQHEAIMKALAAFRTEMRDEFAALRAEREQELPGLLISKRVH